MINYCDSENFNVNNLDQENKDKTINNTRDLR